MKNSNYWHNRFLEIQKRTFRKVENLEEKNINLYKNLIKDIDKEINYWYNRFAKNNNISYHDAIKKLNSDELEEFNWNLEKYTEIAKENKIVGSFNSKLENASIKVHKNRLDLLKLELENKINEAYKTLNNDLKELLKDIYKDTNYMSFYEVSKAYGQGIEFASIADERLKLLIENPWADDGLNFSNRIWRHKDLLLNQLNKELVTGFIRGKTIDEITSNISKKIFDNNGKKATSEFYTRRIVYSESAFFAESARKDCYNFLGLEKYKINATLDSTTCKDCLPRDNKIYSMEEYVIGVTAPVFHPFCRCTTVPFFDDDFVNSERFARDENGNPIYVLADMSFEEYKNKYLKIDEKSDIINKNVKDKDIVDVHVVGKINREIYSVVSKDIATDEVIITDERIQHIKERHPNDYERFKDYIPLIIKDPDYILEANKPNTAFILKSFNIKDENFQLILRLKTQNDPEGYKNSIITFLKIEDKKWRKYIRNKNILYKKE